MSLCGACGSEGAKPFNLRKGDEVVATGVTCDRCLMEVMAEVQELDRQYNDLVAEGVAPSEAMRVMYARADRTPTHLS